MKPNNNNKKRVFINTFFISAGTIVEKVIFFLITVLIARYLSKEQYGEYATALGLATFFSLISNLNMGTTVIRAINLDKKNENENFTNCIIIKLTLIVIAYVCLLFALYITNYNNNIVQLTLTLGFVRLSSEFITTLYAFFEVKEKFNIIALFVSFFSISLIIGTLFIINLNGDYFQLVNIRLLITAIFLLLIFSKVSVMYSFIFNYNKIKKFLIDMLPFAISFILQNVVLNIGIILLPIIHGSIYAGIYQNGFIFILAVSFIPVNLIRVLIPFLYKFNINDNWDKFQFSFEIYSKLFAIISFYLLIFFYFYSNNIISLIFGNKYIETMPVLKILSLGFPFIFTVGHIIIMTINRQKINTIIDILSTITNLIISYILIYHYSSEGAAAALIIYFAMNYILTHGYLIWNKIIEYKKIFLIWLKLSIFTISIYFLQKYFLIEFHFIISILLNTVLYLIFNISFIIKKDDIRIFKEIFNKK